MIVCRLLRSTSSADEEEGKIFMHKNWKKPEIGIMKSLTIRTAQGKLRLWSSRRANLCLLSLPWLPFVKRFSLHPDKRFSSCYLFYLCADERRLWDKTTAANLNGIRRKRIKKTKKKELERFDRANFAKILTFSLCWSRVETFIKNYHFRFALRVLKMKHNADELFFMFVIKQLKTTKKTSAINIKSSEKFSRCFSRHFVF